ncbi:MAG: ABC transporter permease [Blastocatellales bacterium]
MNPLNRKLIRDLSHMRGQVVAIALVVSCGISAFVTMRSNYYSLKASQVTYYAEYRFAEVFANLKRGPDWLSQRIAEIPGVTAVQTRVVAEVTLDVKGLEEPARGRIISVPERRAPMLNDLSILRGRYIEHSGRDEVIISSAFAEANKLNPGDTLDAVINGRWQRLKIVGTALSPEYVYEIRAGDIFPDNRRFGVMWMSREALAAAFDMKGAFNDVALTLSRDANEAAVIECLDVLLAKYGGLGAYGRKDQPSDYFVSNEIEELQFTSTLIPAIFLGVMAFLIHLSLSRLVSTQRDQIAVLKAFGYGNLAVGFHYLKMALAAVTGGIVLGIAVGMYFGTKLTELYSQYFRFPVYRYEAGFSLLGYAVLISFAAAAIGSMVAVWRAISLPPAEAMRPEPPARFQAGFIEWFNLHRLLSPAARIIIRNLERHPIKAFLSMFGIALSVSLLVVGFFMYYDAIERVIDVQFNHMQREDVFVIFNELRPSQARYDLASLPGVMRVEALRSVPARLRFGHRSRRLALMGMESGADLRRIVTTDYSAYRLPDNGLVLTTELADQLGAKVGDQITVEVLEGARPVRQITLAGTVDDLIGLSAYMEINALNRLMREGGNISGAFLMVDSREQSDLYLRLKRMPTVGGVNVPAASLASFNETMAKMLGVSTTILIVFSCIIAFGMVYNGARIALSERGRELASLRVLGFTQREIGVMLLGEQTILTAIAIPFGCLMGYGLSALIVNAIDNEMIRLPLVVSSRTYLWAFAVIAVAALLSGLLVIWRLRHLDLIEVLKTRE